MTPDAPDPHPGELSGRLRLIVITDGALAAPRSVFEVVEAALHGGAPGVQLRDKGASARDLVASARRLRELTRAAGALLFVNDRLDVALSVGADGVHLGPDDIPVAAARAVVPSGFLIGYSTDDPVVARAAVTDGADYLGCGTVNPTSSKRDAGHSIGFEGLRRVVDAVDVPVVGIGGIGPTHASDVAATGAAGAAVIGAVMQAGDPAASVRELLAPWA